MIEKFEKKPVADETVLRLAGLPPTSIEAVLLGRGVRPENIPETKAVLEENGAPFSPEEMVESTFVSKAGYPTPFPIGRYGNGDWPVYYAASAVETCIAEVAYHLSPQALQGRYYTLVACRFDGGLLELVGQQNEYPDLVSPTSAGYPFCQQIASEARSVLEGLHAPSARHSGGVCIPVFARSSLSQPRGVTFGRFVKGADEQIEFQPV